MLTAESVEGALTAAPAVCRLCSAAPHEGARFCDACGSPLAASADAAECKPVTVLFTELVIRSGYTCNSRKLPARVLILRLDLTTRKQ